MDKFTQNINNWYQINKRDLPWRNTTDPYKIWISEIILQQTQVIQGLKYYLKFTDNFPNVQDLAKASEDEILNLWQGLGYYSRARNLHKTSRLIVNKYKCAFPTKYQDIISLHGIGPYTAAAISSIAFGQPYAAVDGNVYRVLSRYFGISEPIDTPKGKKQINEIASEVLLISDPGTHNQALMEFGALFCTPSSPNCEQCPLVENCFALRNNQVNILPIKSKKTKQRSRYFNYFLIEQKNFIYLHKRIEKDIWENLYELPLIENKILTPEEEVISSQDLTNLIGGNDISINSIDPITIHILSHQKIHARFFRLTLNGNNILPHPLVRINKKDIYKFAVPRLVEKFLQKQFNDQSG